MRCLPKISGKSVFAGDVVAFRPPPGVSGDLLIRRVAAVEGEEMISDDPEDSAFHLKPGDSQRVATVRSHAPVFSASSPPSFMGSSVWSNLQATTRSTWLLLSCFNSS